MQSISRIFSRQPAQKPLRKIFRVKREVALLKNDDSLVRSIGEGELIEVVDPLPADESEFRPESETNAFVQNFPGYVHDSEFEKNVKSWVAAFEEYKKNSTTKTESSGSSSGSSSSSSSSSSSVSAQNAEKIIEPSSRILSDVNFIKLPVKVAPKDFTIAPGGEGVEHDPKLNEYDLGFLKLEKDFDNPFLEESEHDVGDKVASRFAATPIHILLKTLLMVKDSTLLKKANITDEEKIKIPYIGKLFHSDVMTWELSAPARRFYHRLREDNNVQEVEKLNNNKDVDAHSLSFDSLEKFLSEHVGDYYSGNIQGVAANGQYYVRFPHGAIPQRMAASSQYILTKPERLNRYKKWSRFGIRIVFFAGVLSFVPNWYHYLRGDEQEYNWRKTSLQVIGYPVACCMLAYPFSVYGCYIFTQSAFSSLVCTVSLSYMMYHDLYFV